MERTPVTAEAINSFKRKPNRFFQLNLPDESFGIDELPRYFDPQKWMESVGLSHLSPEDTPLLTQAMDFYTRGRALYLGEDITSDDYRQYCTTAESVIRTLQGDDPNQQVIDLMHIGSDLLHRTDGIGESSKQLQVELAIGLIQRIQPIKHMELDPALHSYLFQVIAMPLLFHPCNITYMNTLTTSGLLDEALNSLK